MKTSHLHLHSTRKVKLKMMFILHCIRRRLMKMKMIITHHKKTIFHNMLTKNLYKVFHKNQKESSKIYITAER